MPILKVVVREVFNDAEMDERFRELSVTVWLRHDGDIGVWS